MNFVINAPAYTHKSFGIRVLYLLGDLLKELGHFCPVVYLGTKIKFEGDVTAIYPEIVKGNPLQARRVVRYVLNHPGFIGGYTTYNKNEHVFYYEDAYKASAEKAAGRSLDDRRLLIVPLELNLFFNDGKPKSGALFYKGRAAHLFPVPEKCTEVHKKWPETRDQMALLMRSAKTFYCCDKNTALVLEAKACGCQVFQPGEKGWVEYTGDYKKYLPPIHDNMQQVKHFLEVLEHGC
jgi:hypothetical protein